MHETGDFRALYELNKLCSADIPGRGAFYSYEEYIAGRINVPSYAAAGVILAVDEGTWVGWRRLRFRTDSQSGR